ncbi:MAG: class I SAM-dependent methyltransferase [Desulfobulbaceae bacterium]|nr:class I SAM-dependent methyltransferase [Desulfobulbaceae bacterium]
MNINSTLKQQLYYFPPAIAQKTCQILLPIARHRFIHTLRLLGFIVSSKRCKSPAPPIEFLRRTALYKKDDLNYLAVPEIHEISGLLQLTSWCRSLYKCDVTFSRAKHILEFGCGCARLIKHFRYTSGVNLGGCDLDREMVSWCQSSFPEIQFFKNNTEPPLDAVASDSIDLIIACSVFTHIDLRNQNEWLTELRRVLKPCGVLLCDVLSLSQARKNLSHSLQQELIQFGVVTIKSDDSESSYSSQVTGQLDVYYTPAEINKRFVQGFTLLNFSPGDLDLLILKKTTEDQSTSPLSWFI